MRMALAAVLFSGLMIPALHAQLPSAQPWAAGDPTSFQMPASEQANIAENPSWSDRVGYVPAKYTDAWELPTIGKVDSPAAVLVRPDGHVAWTGDGTDAGLADALTRWFGPPVRGDN
jgi:hypothetical protein